MDVIIRDGLWGFIVGDAMGAAVEFGERWMRDLDPVKEMRSGGMFEVPIGGWTDDTSMVLATFHSLQAGYDPKDMMNRFVDWIRKGDYSLFDYPIGIGKQILRAIEEYECSGDIHTCGRRTEQDNGNGSLMRILPICLYCYKKEREKEISTEQAIAMIHEVSSLTHAHIRSNIACGLYYFIVCEILMTKSSIKHCMQMGLNRGFTFYRNTSPYKDINIESELAQYHRLSNLEVFSKEIRDNINSSGYVVDTLEAAIWCLLTESTYKASILKAVNLGLDTDTIAAVAGGLAGLYYRYEGIPKDWIANIKKKGWIGGYIGWEKL